MKDLDGMEKTRNQVDEVTGMMRGNMTKIMERDGKLEDLEMKADQLHVDSQQFQVNFNINVLQAYLIFFRKPQ